MVFTAMVFVIKIDNHLMVNSLETVYHVSETDSALLRMVICE